MKKGTIGIIAVVAIIVMYAISAYNGMVNDQESATTALANVFVKLHSEGVNLAGVDKAAINSALPSGKSWSLGSAGGSGNCRAHTETDCSLRGPLSLYYCGLTGQNAPYYTCRSRRR